jgi:hypothetical protein
MPDDFDRSKSLQELEQMDCGEPKFGSSLVITVHRLRRKPLADFTIEDLRRMIGQKLSLPYLMPLALERLEENPLAEGDCYDGDLLHNVLRVGSEYWANEPNYRNRVRAALDRAKKMLPSFDEIARKTIEEVLRDASSSLKE